jgi:hypothetical protein
MNFSTDPTDNLGLMTSGIVSYNGVTGVFSALSVIPISNGGTNTTTFANTDGVIYYNGTKLVSTTAGSAGQILVSEGGNSGPTFQTITGTGQISVVSTGGSIIVGNTNFFADTFIENNGTATPTSGILNFLGAGGITTTGANSTVTISLSGSGSFSSNGVVYYNGTALVTVTGSAGQILVSEGGDSGPTFQTITGAGQITVVSTGGSIIIGNANSFASSFIENSGTATPTNGILNILGTGGITTTGANNTVTVSLSGSGSFSSNGVIYYNGTALVTATGSTGQILVSEGGNSGPTFQTITGAGQITVVSTGGSIVIGNSGSVASNFVENSGTATPTNGILNILGAGGITTTGANNTVTVSLSGSGSFSSNGVIYYNGTALVTATGSAGQILVSEGGNSGPTFQTITGTGQITVVSTGGSIVIGNSGSVASSFVENSGTATPTNGILNILGTGGITTTGANNTVTVSLSGSGSFSSNGVVYYNGTALVTTTGTVGQILTINNSGTPLFATFTFIEDSGSATFSASNSLVFNGGGGLSTSGTNSIVTVSMTGSGSFATDGVFYWNGNAFVTTAAADSSVFPQILSADQTTNIPTFFSLEAGSGISISSDGSTEISISASGSIATTYTADNSTSATPSGNILNIFGTNGILTIGSGNTLTIYFSGASSFATDGVFYWNGTTLATTAVGSPGQVLVSEGVNGAPSYQTITGSGQVTVVSTGGSIIIGTTSSVASSFVEDVGTATPTNGTLHINGGTGVSTSGTNNTVIINAVGGGLKWNNITTTVGTPLVPSNGYVAAATSGIVLFTPPASPSFGDLYAIVGNASSGNTGWRISLGANQTIQAGNQTVVGSTYSSTMPSDCIELLCIVGGVTSIFAVMDMQGAPRSP